MKIDITQIFEGQVDDTDGMSIPILISSSDLSALLAEYDPNYSFSPDASTSREIARLILDAALLFTSGSI